MALSAALDFALMLQQHVRTRGFHTWTAAREWFRRSRRIASSIHLCRTISTLLLVRCKVAISIKYMQQAGPSSCFLARFDGLIGEPTYRLGLNYVISPSFG